MRTPAGWARPSSSTTYASRAYGRTIDHLVIGPTGIFVIETKNVAGKVRIAGDELWIGGRRVAVVADVDREIAAVELGLAPLLGSLALRVSPLICAHRADLPWFNRRVSGIAIVSDRGLVKAISNGPAGQRQRNRVRSRAGQGDQQRTGGSDHRSG